MTTEIEKKFFEMFEIEPEFEYTYEIFLNKSSLGIFNMIGTKNECEENIAYVSKQKGKEVKIIKIKKVCPEITAEKVLELICLINKQSISGVNVIHGKTIDELKNYVIRECMLCVDFFKPEVQKLFEVV